MDQSGMQYYMALKSLCPGSRDAHSIGVYVMFFVGSSLVCEINDMVKNLH